MEQFSLDLMQHWLSYKNSTPSLTRFLALETLESRYASIMGEHMTQHKDRTQKGALELAELFLHSSIHVPGKLRSLLDFSTRKLSS